MRDLRLLLAAGPRDDGARALLRRAVERSGVGNKVDALLTGAGLDWARDDPAVLREAAAAGVMLRCCSRSVRDRRIDPLSIPAAVQWSSLTSWLGEAPADCDSWSAFP